MTTVKNPCKVITGKARSSYMYLNKLNKKTDKKGHVVEDSAKTTKFAFIVTI